MAKRMKRKYKFILPLILLVVLAVVFWMVRSLGTGNKYSHALELMNNESFSEASSLFSELGDYQDSRQLMEECQKGIVYQQAEKDLKQKEFDKACQEFKSLSGYKDSSERFSACEIEKQLSRCEELIQSGELIKALESLQELQTIAASEKKAEIDEKLNALADMFCTAGDYDNAQKAVESVSDQNSVSEENRSRIAQAGKTESQDNKEDLHQELQEMVIYNDESIEKAEEIIGAISEDYEDTAAYQQLISEYESYLGAYQNPTNGLNAYVEIRNGSLVIEENGLVTAFEYPYLSTRNYIDDDNYTEYSVLDANTISVITLENGVVTRYESYLR